MPSAGFDREPHIRAVRAKADAFVSGTNMQRNFGRATDLRVDASPTFRAFIRFNVDVRSGNVQRVSLLLYSHSRSQRGYQVRIVEEPWRERRITFLNAPPLSPSFILSGPAEGKLVEGRRRHLDRRGDERRLGLRQLRADHPLAECCRAREPRDRAAMARVSSSSGRAGDRDALTPAPLPD